MPRPLLAASSRPPRGAHGSPAARPRQSTGPRAHPQAAGVRPYEARLSAAFVVWVVDGGAHRTSTRKSRTPRRRSRNNARATRLGTSRESRRTTDRCANAAAASPPERPSSSSARSHGTNPCWRSRRKSGNSARRRIRDDDGRSSSSHSETAAVAWARTWRRGSGTAARASNRHATPMKPKSMSVPSACARVQVSVHVC